MRRFNDLTGRRFLAFLSIMLLAGCAGITPQMQERLDLADRELAVGNHTDALSIYEEIAPQLEKAGLAEAGKARLGQAMALLALGRYEQADQTFELVGTDSDVPYRLDAELHHGHALRELARRKEPTFLERTPTNSMKIRELDRQATDYYERARHHYNRVLEESPSEFEARLGNGECLLRVGILRESSQLLRTARETLDGCVDERTDDKRALYLLGKATQADLGAGKMLPAAAEKILLALELDRQGNYDLHTAYRDTLGVVRDYTSPPELEKIDESQRETMQLLVQALDGYQRDGRKAEGAWGEQLAAAVETYVAGFRTWDREKTRREQNVVLAKRLVTERNEQFSLEIYQEAMDLLEEIDEKFRDEAYMQERKVIQDVFVYLLLGRARRLGEIGEWERAQTYQEKAIKYAQIPFVDAVAVQKQARDLGDELTAERQWKRDCERIREFIGDGDLQLARSEYDRAKGVQEVRIHIAAERLSEIEAELSKGDQIAELIRLWDAGEKASDRPSESLTHFQNAYTLAVDNEIPFWEERIKRKVAGLYYRLDQYQLCLERTGELQNQSTDDLLLAAKCYYQKGELADARRHLDKIQDAAVLEPADQKLAGLAFIDSAQSRQDYEKVRAFLERAPSDDPQVREGLSRCYQGIFSTLSDVDLADRRPVIQLLNQWVDLDANAHDARLHLGLHLYALAEASKDDDLLARSHEEMSLAVASGAKLSNDTEKDRYGKLVAWKEDFVHLDVGRTWEYSTSEGTQRTVKVLAKLSNTRFRVQTTDGSSNYEEIWENRGDILRRQNAAEEIAEELPIQLPTPDHMPSWEFAIRATTYKATVVGTGVTCMAGGKVHDNCLQVQVTPAGGGAARNHFFAPGIGEVKMESSAYSYELRQVDNGSVATARVSS